MIFIEINSTKTAFLILLSVCLSVNLSFSQKTKQPIDYVDVFIGTSNSRWMLGPYVSSPFGMVQLGPDNQETVWMGGYEYAINSVSGFSHIHAWTMGGLRLMPTTADLVFEDKSIDSPYKGANSGYHSRILKDSEKAFPGYYSVYLYDHDVLAEMTVTKRCGFQRYKFPEKEESRILVDLFIPTERAYGYRVLDAKIKKVNQTELEGYAQCVCGPWSDWNNYTLHFVIQFSKPFEKMNGWNEGRKQIDIDSISGKNDIGAYVTYKTKLDDEILVKTGISMVSIEQARLNLEVETKPFGWDFEKAVHAAKEKWSNLLNRIIVEGGTEEDRVKFYTNFYRSFCSKQTWNDVNGKYVDPCENIQQLKPNQEMYGGDAFWNTFWNLNGLWSLISPDIVKNWVITQLELYKHTGWTSKGPTGLEYSGIMEGSHEIALMVSAFQKGIFTEEPQLIYDAIKKNVIQPGERHSCIGNCGNPHFDFYIKYGYMPLEIGPTNQTLDYAFDDWCVAQMALAIGNKKDCLFFQERSQNYKNSFHPDLKFVVPKDSLGNWKKDFNVFSKASFIEGNSWQYSLYVPHDAEGLISLIGRDNFNERLEYGFKRAEDEKFAAHAFDNSRGQGAEYYINHGNEVNMQAAWLFNYSGKPWLTQKYTNAIMNAYYGSTPYHGWEGDEDEGQMGAWFVNSAMGLFEMDGGCSKNSKVDISTPLFEKITIQLDSNYYKGEQFVIKANNLSKENIYIQSAKLNDKRLTSPQIGFFDIVSGGKLELELGATPNKNWGTNVYR